MDESVMTPLLISLNWDESNMGLWNYCYSIASKSTKLFSYFFLIDDLCLVGTNWMWSSLLESGIKSNWFSEYILLL